MGSIFGSSRSGAAPAGSNVPISYKLRAVLRSFELPHRQPLDAHFRLMGRKKWYETIEEMRADLDACHAHCNHKQPHQGRATEGRTPFKAFMAGLPKKENAKMKPTKKAA